MKTRVCLRAFKQRRCVCQRSQEGSRTYTTVPVGTYKRGGFATCEWEVDVLTRCHRTTCESSPVGSFVAVRTTDLGDRGGLQRCDVNTLLSFLCPFPAAGRDLASTWLRAFVCRFRIGRANRHNICAPRKRNSVGRQGRCAGAAGRTFLLVCVWCPTKQASSPGAGISPCLSLSCSRRHGTLRPSKIRRGSGSQSRKMRPRRRGSRSLPSRSGRSSKSGSWRRCR